MENQAILLAYVASPKFVLSVLSRGIIWMFVPVRTNHFLLLPIMVVLAWVWVFTM